MDLAAAVFLSRLLVLVLLSINFGMLIYSWFEDRRNNKARKELQIKLDVVKEILDGLERNNETSVKERKRQSAERNSAAGS